MLNNIKIGIRCARKEAKVLISDLTASTAVIGIVLFSSAKAIETVAHADENGSDNNVAT
jgi:hypothetical protein